MWGTQAQAGALLRQDLKQSTEVAIGLFIGSFYHNQCAVEPGTLGQVEQKVGKGGQAVLDAVGRDELVERCMERGDASKTCWCSEDGNVLVAVIRPEDDENLEKAEPQGRLNGRDTVQKILQDLLVLWMQCPGETSEFKLMLSFSLLYVPYRSGGRHLGRVLRRRLRSCFFHMGAVLTLRRRWGGRLL